MIELDVADEADMVATFADVTHRLGKVDLLINDAGVVDSFLPGLEQDAADMDRLLHVNLMGCSPAEE